MSDKTQRSSPYYPQSNLVIERFHGTLKSRIDRMLSCGSSFDVALQQAMLDIRSLPNASTDSSPFRLFFGREMPTRWRSLQQPLSCTPRSLSDEYSKRLNKGNFKLVQFEEGESVVLRNPHTHKFSEKAQILKRTGHGSWLVKAEGRKAPRVVNQRYIRKA